MRGGSDSMSSNNKKNITIGRGLVAGIAEGEALVSRESLVWSHGVDPTTGKIDDVRVSICGECVKDKILIYPIGKGSTSGATWMLEAVRCGNGPKAIINNETELIIVAGAVLSQKLYGKNIPVIDRTDKDLTEEIKTGDIVRVDGVKGIVEVVKRV
ncbi:MAG: hypothetical protein DBY08_00090 [Clostridiales bacterium]|nr:MAG: hypothetical protein DBY08_00090 [Clostridiales bacterium]